MALTHRYFWDTRHLKAELAGRALSEGKSFLYFFAITGFDWLQFTATRLSPTAAPPSDWEQADALATLALSILGLAYLFLRNGGGGGKDFLYRYFPLSFVIGWKYMVTASVALWLFGLAAQDMEAFARGWLATAILAAFNLAMFLHIGRHMEELASAGAAPPPGEG